MKSKAPFILVLIGVIWGFFASLIGLFEYFLIFSVGSELIGDIYGDLGINLELLELWLLISSIIGLVLSLVLIYYIVKLARGPSKNDCIVVLILGGLGLLSGMGLGGILVLVGGIIGLVKYNQ